MKYFTYKVKEVLRRAKTPMLVASTWVAFFCSMTIILFVGYNIGFKVSDDQKLLLFSIFKIIILVLSLVSILRILYNYDSLVKTKTRMEWISLILLFVTSLIVFRIDPLGLSKIIPFLWSYWIVILVLIYFSIVEISNDLVSVMAKEANPIIIFVVSFLVIITAGTTLLLLPNSTYNGISIVDALFTTTSAVCVTGLNCVPFDQTFTLSGQIIILLLIQVGGLGVITITSFFALFFLKGIAANSEFMIKDIVSGNRSADLVSLLRKIIKLTFFVETTGAIAIYFLTGPYLDMSGSGKIFFAVFHSISAFCNAGFSTLHDNLADKVLLDIGPFYLVISFLVIIGGIGFPILSNILKVFHHKYRQFFRVIKGRKSRRYAHDWDVSSIVVLKTTALLLLFGTLYFFIFEGDGLLSRFSGADKVIQAFFHAVVPRTAGFNSVDLSSMVPATFMVTLVLMWIGAAPQSTGGGIKVTTFALMIRNLTQFLKGNDRVELFGREVSPLSVTRAFATISLSVMFITTAEIAIVAIEPSLSPGKILFEIVSAIGTVGLSMGITYDLQPESKLILSLLMFIGRVGVVTFLSAFMRAPRGQRYSYPKTDIMIS